MLHLIFFFFLFFLFFACVEMGHVLRHAHQGFDTGFFARGMGGGGILASDSILGQTLGFVLYVLVY